MQLELPIYWTQHFSKKPPKTTLVSMNWYRNAYYYAQNSMKKDFHELVHKQLGEHKIEGKFRLNLDIYYKNVNCDGSNVAALIEKFVLDALQQSNTIVNDNVKYHIGSTWKVIGQSRDNPRCLITIIDEEVN